MEWKQIELVIDQALAEDLGSGDITTEVLVSPQLQGKASIQLKPWDAGRE